MKNEKPKFDDWLKDQAKRNDPIGDLSRDAKRDRAFPRGGTRSKYETYLRMKGACSDAIEALRDAWEEFSGRA